MRSEFVSNNTVIETLHFGVFLFVFFFFAAKFHPLRNLQPKCFVCACVITPDKWGFPHNIILTSPQKHMLWVLIRNASVMRH